ncbi:MAG: M1 family aminopeptidase [Planctomycetota bacterium]|jgi:aminopeptidase N
MNAPRTLAVALFAGLGCAMAAPLLFAADPPLRFTPDRAIDITHVALELDVDLPGRRIEGEARIDARALIVPLEQVVLDAVDLDVRQVTDQDGNKLPFRVGGEKLTIDLAQPLAKRGAKFELTIAYAAQPRTGLHFFGPSSTEPDVPLQVWSQNETIDARHWIPCIDHPEERQTTELAVTVPTGFTVVSNGKLVSRKPVAGKDRVRWHYSKGEPNHTIYLVMVAIGRFHTEATEWRGRRVAYHVPVEKKDDIARTFDQTVPMLDHFSELFGEYPWVKYEQVVVEQFAFGGMENTGATTLNERTLHDERAHLDYSSEWLIAHELGHQWFGDLLTCRDWAHIWLNEGFATFCEAMWAEHRQGTDGYLTTLMRKQGSALRGGRGTPLVRPRYHKPSDTFGGGTYPKGGWVLHMLRSELGDDDFFAGMRAYVERYRGKSVETDDFRRIMEEVSGRSLGRFFQQWTERAGHPVFEVKVGWLQDQRLLEVRVRQTQGGEPFAITLDVACQKADGERLVTPLALREGEARLLLPLAARPRFVTIDPEAKVLKEVKFHADRDLKLAALTGAPGLVERYDAVRSLEGDHHGSVLDALAAVVAEDSSALVRGAAASALAAAPGDHARDLVLRALADLTEGTEKTARLRALTRRTLVEGVRRRHADPVVEAALVDLVPGEPSYRVLEAIATGLGRMEGKESLEALFTLARMDSHNDQVRRSALRALSDRKGLEGLSVIEAYAAPPTRWEAREAALRALGKMATRKELGDERREVIVDRLARTLQEPSRRFRRVAADALRAVGSSARRSERALEALASHDPDKGVRGAAKKALEAVRKGEPRDEQLARLIKELEDAKGRAKSLEDRLEKVEARVGGSEPEEGKAAPGSF